VSRVFNEHLKHSLSPVSVVSKMPIFSKISLSEGGKAISTPRARSPYILCGIPNPKREYKRITELIIIIFKILSSYSVMESDSIL